MARSSPRFAAPRTPLRRAELRRTSPSKKWSFSSRLRRDVDRLTEAWAELSAGPPRVGEGVFSWLLPHLTDEAFFTPTPGPGDSEGGDVYSP